MKKYEVRQYSNQKYNSMICKVILETDDLEEAMRCIDDNSKHPVSTHRKVNGGVVDWNELYLVNIKNGRIKQ